MKRAEDEIIPGLSEFEYFRYKSWIAKSVLQDFTQNIQFTDNVEDLAVKLRAVSSFLKSSGIIYYPMSTLKSCLSRFNGWIEFGSNRIL